MNPQFTYDNKGKAVGVFLPIDDWNRLKDNMPADELPQWQKEIIDQRLMMIKQNPESLISLDDFMAEMEKESDEEI